MTFRRNLRTPRRPGFTLVEMLVSSALIIFVMVILTQVFSIGLTSLRNLRGRGHLQDHLRSATMTLRRDLAAPHFGKETDALHGPYLSQQRIDQYDWTPPKEGFFRIYQGTAGTATIEDSNQDGMINSQDADSDGMYSYVATTHYLHFTVRTEPAAAQGGGRDRFFSTASLSQLPPATQANLAKFSKPEYLASDGVFYSPWAEVAYYLRPSGQYAGATSLYTLHRRRRILVDAKPGVVTATVPPITINAPAKGSLFSLAKFMRDVSVYEPGDGTARINTPGDVAAPYRRFGMQPVPTAINPNAAPPAQAAGLNLTAFSTLRPGAAALDPRGLSFVPLYDDTRFDDPTTGATAPDVGGDDVLLENVISFQVRVSWEIPGDVRIGGIPNNYVGPISTTANSTIVGSNTGIYSQKVNAPIAFPQAGVSNSTNPDYPFDDLPFSPINHFGNDTLKTQNGTLPAAQYVRVFDTWSGENHNVETGGYVTYNSPLPTPLITLPGGQPNWNARYTAQLSVGLTDQIAPVTIPLRIRVKAIQIRIRVWDSKTQQARQVTVVQDL